MGSAQPVTGWLERLMAKSGSCESGYDRSAKIGPEKGHN